MRLIIADDHALIRAGIRRLIEALDDCEVVGEAGNGHEALELVSRLQPDLLLLDLSMPGMGGLDALAEVHKRHAKVKVLILSMHTDMQHVRGALSRGAVGFLVKDSAPAELALALATVARGQTFLSPRVSADVVAALVNPNASTQDSPRLSPRQWDVLGYMARGYGTKEIASQLDVSVKTVETHRARMMETLGFRRGAELLRYALSHPDLKH